MPDDEAEGAIGIEALNKLDVPGFPNYELVLKVGASIILLQNLGIEQQECDTGGLGFKNIFRSEGG
jgi:hypothetical protein